MSIRTRKHPLLRGISLALALGTTAGLAGQLQAKEVTWDDIANDARSPENVLGYGIGPKAQRYSPMTTINRDNVERLVPAWSFSFGAPASGVRCHQCPPRWAPTRARPAE